MGSDLSTPSAAGSSEPLPPWGFIKQAWRLNLVGALGCTRENADRVIAQSLDSARIMAELAGQPASAAVAVAVEAERKPAPEPSAVDAAARELIEVLRGAMLNASQHARYETLRRALLASPVAQRPEALEGGGAVAQGATVAPQERQVSNLRQPAASSTDAACVLASAPGTDSEPEAAPALKALQALLDVHHQGQVTVRPEAAGYVAAVIEMGESELANARKTAGVEALSKAAGHE